MRGLTRGLLRLLSRGWHAGVLANLSNYPRPTDYPQVHAGAKNADRILVVGTGAAVGWGVLSHDLGLPGALAREVSKITGRGAVVDVLADPWATADSARRLLRGQQLWRYDAVLLTIGLNELAQFAPTDVWRRSLSRLVDWMSTEMSTGSLLYLLGVHEITALTPYDRVVRPFVEAHRASLNRTTRELAAEHSNVRFLPIVSPPRPSTSLRGRTAEEYREGARALASIIGPELDVVSDARRRRNDRDPRTLERAERERQHAVDKLPIVDTESAEQFDRIVDLARSTFGTSSAALTIIDGDRQFQLSGVNAGHVAVLRTESICDVTIRTPGAFVTSDATTDERLAARSAPLSETPVRFYAGYPVESATGERLGAICVFDSETRNIDEFDGSLLAQFAVLVQRILWDSADPNRSV